MSWWLGLALLTALPAAGQGSLRTVVKEHRLSNGMLWLIVERPNAPVFTGFVRVRVGGADEQPGSTGLAHLFEHMAFKGTPVLGTTDFQAEQKLLVEIARTGDALTLLQRAAQGNGAEAKALEGQLQTLSQRHKALTDENAMLSMYQLNGAVGLNATTDKDVTSYFVSLPKNRLAMWLYAEASRLVSPVLRDFYTERSVVMEERRMSIESSPAGAAYEELMQVAFTSSPYRWPTVGYQADLAGMTLAEAHRFHEAYYVPANAVGCVVGDVTLAEVVPLLEQTFGAIPAAPAPPAPRFSEPPSRAARRSTVFFDASPRVYLAFRKPAPPVKDDDVFDLITVLLGEGRTGRLHQRLVLTDRLAQSVAVFAGPGSRLDNELVFAVTPLQGVSNEQIEKALWAELDRLKTQPVPERELQKVRNRVTADQARAIDSNAGLAGSLSYFQAVLGDWRYLADQPTRVAKVTAQDIQDVASRYFRPENSTTVDLARPAKVVTP